MHLSCLAFATTTKQRSQCSVGQGISAFLNSLPKHTPLPVRHLIRDVTGEPAEPDSRLQHCVLVMQPLHQRKKGKKLHVLSLCLPVTEQRRVFIQQQEDLAFKRHQ